MPTRRALWRPTGQQGMIPTPGQPTKRDGIGAVHYHTGETGVLVRHQKRRRERAALLHALLDTPPEQTVSVAWDHARTHADEAVEAVVRGAAGRLVLLSFPPIGPGSPRLSCAGGTCVARGPMGNSVSASRR
jgi:putative transposase